MKVNDMTESKPLVSIHIITYNQIGFIKETLDSALDQDYENFEVIVADDGSTDGTPDVISEYAKNYPGKIVPIVGKPNLGITGNSNRGLAACNGKYIAFMGGDDLFLPGKLTAQVKWLEQNEERVLCYHDMDVFESSTNETLYLQSDYYKFHKGDGSLLINYGTFFGATTVMVRSPKEMILNFDERVTVASDWLYWFEILENQSGKVGYIDGIYARYRKHGNNITGNGTHALKDALLTLDIIDEKYTKYFKLTKQKRSELYLIHSIKLLKKGSFFQFFKLFTYSLLECRGLWLAPFKLLNQKLYSCKRSASTKFKQLYKTLRYRQFELYRAKKQGMNVGSNSLFVGRQKFGSEPYLITIGDNCLITDGVRFITHDGSIQVPMIKFGSNLKDVYGKYSTFNPIKIGSNVFIGVNSILLPGTEVEQDCIIAAGAILSGSYPKGSVIAGAPAKVVSSLDTYWEKNMGRVVDLSSVGSPLERKVKIIDSTKSITC